MSQQTKTVILPKAFFFFKKRHFVTEITYLALSKPKEMTSFNFNANNPKGMSVLIKPANFK